MFSIGKRRDAHVTDLLSAYMDNQLSERQRADVEAHLRDCSDCADDLRSLQTTVRALRALPMVAVPRSFIIQPELQPWPIRPYDVILRLATAATTVALVLVMAGDLFLRGYQPATSPAPQPQAFAPAPAPAMSPPPMPKAADESRTLGADVQPTQEAGKQTAATFPPAALSPVPAAGAVAQEALRPTDITPKAALAAPTPAATAPSILRAAAAPTATVTPTTTVAAATITVPTPTTEPIVLVMETATPMTSAPAVAATPAPVSRGARSSLRAVEIALAGLLVVLLVATVTVNQRQRRP